MSTPDLFERELLERELAEDPRARAARLAGQRWVTQLRLWAAMDRDGVMEPGDQARYICRSLWPDLRPDTVDQYVDAVQRNTADGSPLRRPVVARDVVGERLERLMVEFGYDVDARPLNSTSPAHPGDI